MPEDRALAVLDIGVLEALVGDDAQVIGEFLLEFRNGATSIARNMVAAARQGKPRDAGALAHKLKSSARAVGALKLGDLCALIEQAGKADDNPAVAELLVRFELEITAVQTYIDRRVGEDP